MNNKIINFLFSLMIFSLIFHNIPKILQMNFIGGPLQSKLIFYPVFVGLIYTIYCHYKFKNVLINFNIFKKFIFIYMLLLIVSLFIGLIYYPYYDLLLSGPVDQIEKMPKLIKILNTMDININIQKITILWMIIRTIKGALFETVYTFCLVYMIYCWYYNNWKVAFNILVKSIMFSLIVIFGYSFIEIFYLAGNEYARNILLKITPFFHVIQTNHGWWPRILQPGQIRSVFAEPAFFSIWAAFALPFIWYYFFLVNKRKSKIFLSFIIIIFTSLMFLTNSRTGVALLFIELLSLLIYNIFAQNLFVLKRSAIILFCVLCAFSMSNFYIENFMSNDNHEIYNEMIVDNQKNMKTIKNNTIKKIDLKNNTAVKEQDLINKNGIKKYYEENFESIFKLNARSNGARFSTIYANIMIGLDNPFFGVGKNLISAYMPDYFPNFAKNNHEVQNWIKFQNEKGILKMSIPNFCIYSLVFAESGVIGFIAYFFPAIYLIVKILKILYIDLLRYEYVFLLIALISILASGISVVFTASYYYWILLGIGYSMCFGRDAKVSDEKNYK